MFVQSTKKARTKSWLMLAIHSVCMRVVGFVDSLTIRFVDEILNQVL